MRQLSPQQIHVAHIRNRHIKAVAARREELLQMICYLHFRDLILYLYAKLGRTAKSEGGMIRFEIQHLYM